MTVRRLFLVLLGLAVIAGAACSSKRPIVMEEETAPAAEEGMKTETIEGDNLGTAPTGETGLESRDLGLETGESGRLKTVYFDFDRYDLKANARDTLRANAALLQQEPGLKVMLEGHCDERGTKEYNLALGDRRANAAYRYLVDLGIDSSRLSTISYGEEYPANPGHNEAAWAQNRRVEFRILK